MGQQIRDLMGNVDGFAMLQGHVELDEAYVGGHRSGKRGRGAAGKTIVMGLKERGGRLITEVITDIKKATFRGVVLENVEKGAIVSNDELMSYGLLNGDVYKHSTVDQDAKMWTYYDYRHDAKHHTNNVESFWKLFKISIRSTHIRFPVSTCSAILTSFRFAQIIVRW